jgi:putative colanic acid biosynthesis UDP-glucose lipid carrier transferase
MNSKNRFILINLVAFEFGILNLILIGCHAFGLPNMNFGNASFLGEVGSIFLTFNFSWLFIIFLIRDKEFYFNPDRGYLKSHLTFLFFFIGFVTTVIALLKVMPLSPPTYLIPIFLFSYLNFLGHKFLLRHWTKNGSDVLSNTLLIASDKVLSNLNGFPKEMAENGYNIIGYLGDLSEPSESAAKHDNVLGNINELPKILGNNPVDEIFIAMDDLEKMKIQQSIQIADNHGIRVKLMPEATLIKTSSYEVDMIGGHAVLKLRQSPLDNVNNTILKRLFDFCFASVVLMILAPVYLVIGILILLDSKGPIYYAPYRKGEAGKTFKCYKFRTMSVSDDPINGTKSTVVDDPRITRVGKFLRKNDLDELPQFFNVLKGDMSVVGPRPHRTNLQNVFRKSVNDYMVRSYVKPGITGWAQVNGWRGPTVTVEQKEERTKHDLWYIENWSFWLDIKVIFRTIFGRHRKKAF